MHDTANFGSFTNSLLVGFRDEYAKLPCLAFPFLSRAPSKTGELDVGGAPGVLDWTDMALGVGDKGGH